MGPQKIRASSEQGGSSILLLMASMKMAIATFLSRILGLVREQLMAYFFGASGLTDAFLVAYRIPNLLRDLLAEGAFSAAFVPVLTKVFGENKEKAKKLFTSLFILLILLTSFLALGIYLFSPHLVAFMAPKFTDNPEKFLLASQLVKMMSPYLICVSLAALCMGGLNVQKVFFLPSLAPATFNTMMIVSMLVFPAVLVGMGKDPIVSLALGVTLGGIGQVLLQLPILFKNRFFSFGLSQKDLFSPEVKKVFLMLGPGLLGFAATQVNVVVNTILASGTLVGAVSWLNYAFRLFQFPIGIIGVSIANSNLVYFSDAWKKSQKKKALDYLKSSLHLSYLFIFLAFVLFLGLREQVVHLIFEHGKFLSWDRSMTVGCLTLYLLGLPFYALYKIFVPVFYTLERPKVPVYCSLFSIVFNIVFCVLLIKHYGFTILALGASLSICLNSLLQGFFLRSYLSIGWGFYFDLFLGKIIVSSVLTFLVIQQTVTKMFFFHESFLMKCGKFLIISLMGVIFYFLLLILFGEKSHLKSFFKRES